MIIGIPKELKNNENRVAITPSGVHMLVQSGHTVFIQKSAGEGSGITDEEYISSGAKIAQDAAFVYAEAEMIMKVKDPIPEEYGLLRHNQVLFTYLHLAADRELTVTLMDKKITSVAYETIQLPDGSLPLLAPMSEVAGRMSVQIGAQFLQKVNGGMGVMLGGVPGVQSAHVVIIGGGIVGVNAAKMALGLGAQVTILDVNLQRLRYLDDIFHGRLMTVSSNSLNIAEAAASADLLIGAVLIPGTKAPSLVTEDMVRQMKRGSVIVDVAVDQGGCVETADHATTHSNPTYVKHGVVHYSVANMPGVVPRTSTFALMNATLPYALQLVNKGYKQAIIENISLSKGVNTIAGNIVYSAVAEAHGLTYSPLQELL